MKEPMQFELPSDDRGGETSPRSTEDYRQSFFDYPNHIWMIASRFRVTCHSNLNELKAYIKEHPLPTLTEKYGEEIRKGMKEHIGNPADELDSVIELINGVDDEIMFKKLVNKALLLVYPKRGPNQEFEGTEFSASI